MDKQRDPAILRRKKIRQGIILGLVGVAVVAITVAVMRLEPAAPSVPESTVWRGTVQRGNMTRSVNGAGTLVPEDVRVIPAQASGRVQRLVLQPGAQVRPDSVIIEMVNPDVEQTVRTTEMSWKTAQAQLANERVRLVNQRLTQENNVSDAQSQYDVALKDLEANKLLAEQGLVADLVILQKQATVSQTLNRLELAKKQLQSAIDTEASQIAPQEAQVNQAFAIYEQAQRQFDYLKVRAGMTGVLTEVTAQVGQQLGAGSQVARVSDPTNLKAVIRISETQTRDLRIGLPAEIDTRNGKVRGHVSRIDPASQGGTVGVDVILEEELPPGARPDLSIDGTIELERLVDVLFVESPAYGQENSTVQLYKMQPDGHAVRVPVKLGRRSVQYVEVVEGLNQGDVVILSDMSTYEAFDRVRIN